MQQCAVTGEAHHSWLRRRRARARAAVAARKVLRAAEQNEHRLAGLDVALERIDRLEIIHIQEDGHARQQQLQLPLDRRDHVLIGPARAGEEKGRAQ